MSDYAITSPKGQEMLANLPAYYETIHEIRILEQTEGIELDDLTLAADSMLDQTFITEASWGLNRWELELGISTVLSKPMEQRRSVVLSKRRGYGTVTVSLVKSVAEAYANGEVTITEDNANYLVLITFISTHGIPDNLTDIQNALRELIPAHLAINYAYNYFIWDDLDFLNLTWDQTDSLNLTWNLWEVYG